MRNTLLLLCVGLPFFLSGCSIPIPDMGQQNPQTVQVVAGAMIPGTPIVESGTSSNASASDAALPVTLQTFTINVSGVTVAQVGMCFGDDLDLDGHVNITTQDLAGFPAGTSEILDGLKLLVTFSDNTGSTITNTTTYSGGTALLKTYVNNPETSSNVEPHLTGSITVTIEADPTISFTQPTAIRLTPNYDKNDFCQGRGIQVWDKDGNPLVSTYFQPSEPFSFVPPSSGTQ